MLVYSPLLNLVNICWCLFKRQILYSGKGTLKLSTLKDELDALFCIKFFGGTELEVMGKEREEAECNKSLSKQILGSRNLNWGLSWIQSKDELCNCVDVTYSNRPHLSFVTPGKFAYSSLYVLSFNPPK